ncbi:MAG: zinc ribbon domain-containing protein [Burkholderiales bacterium]|nr:zinc ribbon domain-containing protein [Burkholderiales bacterium]
MLIECWECKAKISDTAASCPQCGAQPSEDDHPLSVAVNDLDMKFSSMFWFLIKAAVAAVPAVVVLYTAATVVGGVISPLLHL